MKEKQKNSQKRRKKDSSLLEGRIDSHSSFNVAILVDINQISLKLSYILLFSSFIQRYGQSSETSRSFELSSGFFSFWKSKCLWMTWFLFLSLPIELWWGFLRSCISTSERSYCYNRSLTLPIFKQKKGILFCVMVFCFWRFLLPMAI